MIHTRDSAEKIISEALGGNMNIATLKLSFWCELINEVRKATIKECAETVEIIWGEIDKQSILKLLDQIK